MKASLTLSGNCTGPNTSQFGCGWHYQMLSWNQCWWLWFSLVCSIVSVTVREASMHPLFVLGETKLLRVLMCFIGVCRRGIYVDFYQERKFFAKADYKICDEWHYFLEKTFSASLNILWYSRISYLFKDIRKILTRTDPKWYYLQANAFRII